MSKRWKTDRHLWHSLRSLARDKRKDPTQAEKRLWEVLRGRRFGGLRFRRQHTVGQFIVDFYCADLRLAIEVDGSSHDAREVEDAERQALIESRRIRVVRFTNKEVLTDLDGVCERLAILAAQLQDDD